MKERIIGAVVLVAVVVLVVPVFLNGPPDADEMVSQAVPLPGQAEQKTQTVVLDRDRDAPVPAPQSAAPAPDTASRSAEEPPATQQAASRPAAGTVVEDTARPAEGAAAAAPESSTGMWAVQIGSFSNQENAERLAADLRKQGFAAFLSKLDTQGGSLHRVRVGPQKDRESAEAMAAQLRRAGHEVKVLPHP